MKWPFSQGLILETITMSLLLQYIRSKQWQSRMTPWRLPYAALQGPTLNRLHFGVNTLMLLLEILHDFLTKALHSSLALGPTHIAPSCLRLYLSMGEILTMLVVKAGMVMHICNLSTLEVWHGGSEPKTRFGYKRRPYVKKYSLICLSF